jgi:hypothetical protein
MRFSKLHMLLAVALALLVVPAAAQARDRDHDGLPDKWEKRNHLSTKKKSANRDPDRDHVDNRNEYRERTKPRRKDSDRDGRRDGREDADHDGLKNAAEDATGNDPVDPDTDNDGVEDGDEQAGTVASYEDGVLTIDLAGGGSVSGKVTEDTHVRCGTESAAERGYRRSHKRGRAAHRGGPGGEGFGPGDGDPGDFEGEGAGSEGFGPCHGDGDEAGDPASDDSCLVEGAAVHEAVLHVGSDGAVWVKVEVLKSSS